jgi:hypothetical protein
MRSATARWFWHLFFLCDVLHDQCPILLLDFTVTVGMLSRSLSSFAMTNLWSLEPVLKPVVTRLRLGVFTAGAGATGPATRC